MFYVLIGKILLKILFYINSFHYQSIFDNLRFFNKKNRKNTFLLFLKKHNIKFISSFFFSNFYNRNFH